jgi:arylsulfatase A-like enzyme
MESDNLMKASIILVALAASPLMSGAAESSAAAKPNIIFILSDDLAQGDVGCYGQKLIQTPNLDRMAGEGTRYTQAYCGTTVCAPSRTSLMTGLHMGHSPVRANREIRKGAGQFPLPEATVTVAQVLKSAGYATACMGKWGMGMFDTTGSPLKVGFDHLSSRELHEGASLQALRWGDWKAVRNGPSKPIEIYDLKTDAAEAKNLAAEKPELVAKAEAMMKAARVDDPNFPLRDNKPGAGKKNAKPK